MVSFLCSYEHNRVMERNAIDGVASETPQLVLLHWSTALQEKNYRTFDRHRIVKRIWVSTFCHQTLRIALWREKKPCFDRFGSLVRLNR